MERKKLIAIRIILIILTLSVMAVIFILSADNAAESDAKSEFFSDSLTYKILELFSLSEEQMQQVIKLSVVIVRKAAHFTEYAALGFLLASVFMSFYVKLKLLIPISFLTGSLYAVSDEIHQYYVPGRSCQLSDMLLDSSGVLAGIFLLLIIVYLYRFIQKRRKPYLT